MGHLSAVCNCSVCVEFFCCLRSWRFITNVTRSAHWLTFQFRFWPAYWSSTVIISSHLHPCFPNDHFSSDLHNIQNNLLQYCCQYKWKCSKCCHCLYRSTASAFMCHSSTVLAMYWGSLHPFYMAQQLSCLVPALRLRNPSKQCSSKGASFIILCSILQIYVCRITDCICGCNPDC